MAHNVLYELRCFPNGMHFISRCVIYGTSKHYSRSESIFNAATLMEKAEDRYNDNDFFRFSFGNDDIKRSTVIAEGYSFYQLKMQVPYLFL